MQIDPNYTTAFQQMREMAIHLTGADKKIPRVTTAIAMINVIEIMLDCVKMTYVTRTKMANVVLGLYIELVRSLPEDIKAELDLYTAVELSKPNVEEGSS